MMRFFVLIFMFVSTISSVVCQEYNFLLRKNGYPIEWGQAENNNGYCSPSYNKYCPSFSKVDCGRRYVGCGAVAAGQIMAKWEWPHVARYGFVDWDSIHGSLYEGGPDDVARLLRNIGRAVDMRYGTILGVEFDNVMSWTFMKDVDDGVHKYRYSGSWRDRTDWENFWHGVGGSYTVRDFVWQTGIDVWHE